MHFCLAECSDFRQLILANTGVEQSSLVFHRSNMSTLQPTQPHAPYFHFLKNYAKLSWLNDVETYFWFFFSCLFSARSLRVWPVPSNRVPKKDLWGLPRARSSSCYPIKKHQSTRGIMKSTRSSADADKLRDAFRGQSRSPNMVPFNMLGMLSY